MSPEVWQQADKLFQAAVELDVGRRAGFLDLACDGDLILRREVDSLLSVDSREWEFLERPALESAALLLADEQPRLTPGQQVGQYEIRKLIGKGGMGEVYLARDNILNRNIALKLLPFDYTLDEVRLRRFQLEAQTVSALNHPNILTVHELGTVKDQQFIATEFIEGETLRKHITRGKLPLWNVLDVAIQTANALAAAHRAGIVHRDIKPENIMLRPDGYVKVLDFGLAKPTEQPEAYSQPTGIERTDISSGLLLGTLRYMSPEQASGQPVDARSDIFSLGVVLYEMITARPPFEHRNQAKLAESILKDAPAMSAVPRKFTVVVGKMLSKDRESRYNHTDELIADLNILKEELTMEPERSGRALGRTSSAFGLIIVLAISSVVGYTSFIFLRSTTTAPPKVKPSSETGTWTTKASISSPRWYAEPAVLNDVLYVAGGWNVCTPFENLESYDPVTDAWTQQAPMLTARGGHGVGVVDGKLFAVGGSVDCGIHIASVEAYDPTSNTWSPRSPLPTPRFGHNVAATNGKLYALGGMASDSNGYLRSNTEYDPRTDTWIERAPMPTPRTGAAVAVVDGIVYVIGGGGYAGTLATVEAYNPLTDSWSTKRPMLTPRISFAASEVGGIIYAFGGNGNRTQVEAYDPAADSWRVVAKMPTRGSHFHAAALGGTIYFAGGSDAGNYRSSVEAFTPEPNARTEAKLCPTSQVSPKAAMPTGRSNMTIGEINGIIYVAGGFEDKAGFLAINEAYDPAADNWIKKAPMPAARETRGTNNAVVDGKLYVIGGNARGKCSDLNEAYDPITNSWTIRSPMPTPRCHLAVVTHNGMIYAIGGTNTSGSIRYATMEVYNPTIDAWGTVLPMPTARQDLGAVSLNGSLYVLGGADPAMSSGPDLAAVESYDPATDTWTIESPMPTPRFAFAAGVLNGSLVVAGGRNNETYLATVEAYDPVKDHWTTLTEMPNARGFLSAVTMNNSMFLVGGNSALNTQDLRTDNNGLNLIACPD